MNRTPALPRRPACNFVSPESWTCRPESRASKQIRRCQLVAVVVMSAITAAVIILFWAGECKQRCIACVPLAVQYPLSKRIPFLILIVKL